MESSRSKRRRLMLSYVSLRPDVPARFESLNDDTLTTILEFVGDKCYRSFGGVNKRCKEVYLNTPGMTKETFLFGYAPLSVIQNRYDNNPFFRAREALCKGVVFYNRKDLLALVVQRRDTFSSKEICEIAAEEGRIDILDEMWNNIDDDYRNGIFEYVDAHAADCGKANVLEWYETKGLYFDKRRCARGAAEVGQLHILKWLREVKDLQLFGQLYNYAARGGQLHVIKWLKEQEVPWDKYTFQDAALKGDLQVLQWLHDEDCPWHEDRRYRVRESLLKPEVIDWCRVNGYTNRVYRD